MFSRREGEEFRGLDKNSPNVNFHKLSFEYLNIRNSNLIRREKFCIILAGLDPLCCSVCESCPISNLYNKSLYFSNAIYVHMFETYVLAPERMEQLE